MLAPSGCKHCGLVEYFHCQRYSEPVGWHKYEEPTQKQILMRMRERRSCVANHKGVQ